MRTFEVLTRIQSDKNISVIVTDATEKEMSEGSHRGIVAEFPFGVVHEEHEQRIRAQELRDLLNSDKIIY
jgi:hypothetical protein